MSRDRRVGWGGGQKVRALPREFIFLGFGREELGMSRQFGRDVPDFWGSSKSLCKKRSCAFFVPYPQFQMQRILQHRVMTLAVEWLFGLNYLVVFAIPREKLWRNVYKRQDLVKNATTVWQKYSQIFVLQFPGKIRAGHRRTFPAGSAGILTISDFCVHLDGETKDVI